MFNTIVGAGAVGAGAASRYGSGSVQKMRLLAAPAPQHCFLEHIFIKKIFRKKLAENLLGSGSGSGTGRFRKSDPNPVKIRPDPQHC
jgi:hypothetical protein